MEIKLNEEQTKKFLMALLPGARRIANERLLQKETSKNKEAAS